MASAPSLSRREELARLAELVENAGGKPRAEAAERFSCGCAALDGLLPGGGLARGSLVEWLADSPGGGAGLFAVIAAREAQQAGGAVVVIDRGGVGGGRVDRDQAFYPPAAVAWGLDLASTIVVHPRNEADERWALDQALRCPDAAAVVAWPRRLDGRTFRRLQLAAEASGSVGLLVRPAAARREPSWAQVRWTVTPQPVKRSDTIAGNDADERWRLAVRLVRVRGSQMNIDSSSNEPFSRDPLGERAEVIVEIDPVSGAIHEARVGNLAAELAPAAARVEPA